MSFVERRLNLLEARVALLEDRFRDFPRDEDNATSTPEDRDRERLGHILRILRKLGGSGSLDEISAQNDITKAGTRAQLVRLIEIGAVTQPSRGHYALKEKM